MTPGSLAFALILPVGALLAIIALSLLAGWLGLGADVRLRDPLAARDLAAAADGTFQPTAISLDRAGLGALLADSGGRVMLLRRHGARFVARELSDHHGIQLERHFLRFAKPEWGVEPITLDLGPEAQHWAASLRRLSEHPAGQGGRA